MISLLFIEDSSGFLSFGLFYPIKVMVSIFDIVLSYYSTLNIPTEAPWGDVFEI